ncbi:MAG: MazG nucleotide pyrophosphohydrolase domain-containing protein [Candidatus Kerfeldbacteria bacterium]
MEIKTIQKKISKIFLNNAKRDNIKVDDDYLMLKLTEELGEFVQSYVIHKKRCRPEKYLSTQKSKKEMSKELSDVLGIILVIANNLNIDLEEAVVKKWITREWVNKK